MTSCDSLGDVAPFCFWLQNVSVFSFQRIETPAYFSSQASFSILPQTISFHSGQVSAHIFQIESTPNPDSMKFVPGTTVLGQGVLDFPTPRLFEIEGVKGVMFGKDYITVTKAGTEEWRYLNPEIFKTIQAFIESGVPFTEELTPPSDTQIEDGDSEAVQMIKEILETRVKPAVQKDGGDIQFHSFVDGIVYLKMVGSCSGCPSSSVTLKGGIERMLMHWVGEVQGVVAVDEDELERLNREVLQTVEAKAK